MSHGRAPQQRQVIQSTLLLYPCHTAVLRSNGKSYSLSFSFIHVTRPCSAATASHTVYPSPLSMSHGRAPQQRQVIQSTLLLYPCHTAMLRSNGKSYSLPFSFIHVTRPCSAATASHTVYPSPLSMSHGRAPQQR